MRKLVIGAGLLGALASAMEALPAAMPRPSGYARYIGKPRPTRVEPVRDDFPSRQTYRAAHRKWTKRGYWYLP